MPVFNDNSLSIGKTPLVKLTRVVNGAKGYCPRQDRGPQPGLFGQVPHRRRHDLGCREERHAQAGRGDRRADQRQHRHRPGLRRGGPRLQADPDHARDHVIERSKLIAAFGANLILTPGAEG